MSRYALTHHGIKGQKWGVRRFQNPDGTLTTAGRKRYGKSDSTDFVVKKGTIGYRFAGGKETVDDRRKYMSTNPRDREVYRELHDFGGLPIDRTNGSGEYTYEFSKDLRVKKGEAVVKDLIDKYGDEDLEKSFKSVQSIMGKYQDRQTRRKYYKDGFESVNEDPIERAIRTNDWSKLDKWTAEYESKKNRHENDKDAYDNMMNFVGKIMDEKHNDVINSYKREGYDAIVDPLDYITSISDTPLIVLNPADSSVLKRYDEIIPWDATLKRSKNKWYVLDDSLADE